MKNFEIWFYMLYFSAEITIFFFYFFFFTFLSLQNTRNNFVIEWGRVLNIKCFDFFPCFLGAGRRWSVFCSKVGIEIWKWKGGKATFFKSKELKAILVASSRIEKVVFRCFRMYVCAAKTIPLEFVSRTFYSKRRKANKICSHRHRVREPIIKTRYGIEC